MNSFPKTCNKYGGQKCTITKSFCAKRHLLSIRNIKACEYFHCVGCEVGIQAAMDLDIIPNTAPMESRQKSSSIGREQSKKLRGSGHFPKGGNAYSYHFIGARA